MAHLKKNVLYLCGQSYKVSMIVNYDSRVVPDLKLPHITTPRVVIYDRRGFIRLATDLTVWVQIPSAPSMLYEILNATTFLSLNCERINKEWTFTKMCPGGNVTGFGEISPLCAIFLRFIE